jgi:hypothetical protein
MINGYGIWNKEHNQHAGKHIGFNYVSTVVYAEGDATKDTFRARHLATANFCKGFTGYITIRSEIALVPFVKLRTQNKK